ncbi:type IV secretion system protein VirD4 [Lachnospiraceae bacterium PF1-21]
MRIDKRKRNAWLVSWMIISLLAIYASYCFASVFATQGVSESNFIELSKRIFRHPILYGTYNSFTVPAIGCSLFACFIGSLLHYASIHTLRTGEEYGTSKWGSIPDINKRLGTEEIKGLFRTKRVACKKARVLGEHVRLSYDAHFTRINNNIIAIGGSGSGKTAFFVIPNLLEDYGSNVYTDPKGTLIEEVGNFLKGLGRRVLCLNLIDFAKSCRYNPFKYLRKPSDVNKLISNLIANTTPAESHAGDPFWEKAEKMYLTSIFYYVWMECPRREMVIHENGEPEEIVLDKTFRSVLFLLDEAAVPSDEESVSPLEIRMNKLAMEKGGKHPAVKSYRRCVKGAGDTVRSIIISANSRFDPFDNEELLRILDDDDIDIPSLAVGVNGDMKTKTSLFCVIPDDDDTWNFVVGMFYTQLFQELYRQARFYGGECPIPVGCWFDEFANIKMPNAFEKILATCRSRAIYIVIILQSLAQLKVEYKEERWEGIVGNCDIMVYLGGKSQSTNKYVSEDLAKETIEKRSQSENRGSHGSTGSSFDSLGRELLMPDEVAKLKDDVLIMIRSEDPVRDRKWDFYKKHKKLRDLIHSYGTYDSNIEVIREGTKLVTKEVQKPFKFLSDESLDYYKMAAERGENVEIYEMDMDTFLTFDFASVKTEKKPTQAELMELMQADWKLKQERIRGEELNVSALEDGILEDESMSARERLISLMTKGSYSQEQLSIIKKAIETGVSFNRILEFAKPDVPIEKMEILYQLNCR